MWFRGIFCAGIATAAFLGLPGFIAPSRAPALPGAVAVGDGDRPALRPTAHPPIPRDLDSLWLVPAGLRPGAQPMPKDAAARDLAAAVDLIGQEKFAEALPRLASPALAKSPLVDYVTYYVALARLRTGAPGVAREGFRRLSGANVPGVLGEWALLGEAMASEQLAEPAEAARVLRDHRRA